MKICAFSSEMKRISILETEGINRVLTGSQLWQPAWSMTQNKNYSEKFYDVLWCSHISSISVAMMMLQYKEK